LIADLDCLSRDPDSERISRIVGRICMEATREFISMICDQRSSPSVRRPINDPTHIRRKRWKARLAVLSHELWRRLESLSRWVGVGDGQRLEGRGSWRRGGSDMGRIWIPRQTIQICDQRSSPSVRRPINDPTHIRRKRCPAVLQVHGGRFLHSRTATLGQG
jgi:hypothetical protein